MPQKGLNFCHLYIPKKGNTKSRITTYLLLQSVKIKSLLALKSAMQATGESKFNLHLLHKMESCVITGCSEA